VAVRNEDSTIGQLVLNGARDWPDTTAISFPDFRWTYRQLECEALTVAKGLRALGVRSGDHVGLVIPNGAHYVAAFFGAAMTGATVVPLNTRYRRVDLLFTLEHSDVSVLLLSRDYRRYFDFEKLVEEICADHPLPRLREVVVLGADDGGEGGADGDRDGSALSRLGRAISDDEIRAVVERTGVRDIGLMLYTSGTTASPKGCLLSHQAMVRCAAVWGQEGIGLGPGESIWIPNPLFHIGALSSMLASVAAGSTFHSLPYFEADAAVRMLTEDAVTAFFPVFDAIALPILEHPDATGLRFERVRYSFCTGNPNNVATVRAALPHAAHLNTYGMTETSGWCALNFDVDEPLGPLPGGQALPGVEIQVRVPGRLAEDGETGTIHVRSWCTITGYYKDPAATEAAIDADGWFRTGDIGVRYSDGSVRFQGRAGDMIKVGGENVATIEVETFLGGHPAVRQVAVVGAPDPRLGTVPAAFVELYPGQSATEEDLAGFCAGSIARFKIPRYFRFVPPDGWPMSTTKIRKTDLSDRIAAEVAQAPSPSPQPGTAPVPSPAGVSPR
jgi:acyl-CoA synthetase (AMP-forming)/AMP-acid ligase II